MQSASDALLGWTTDNQGNQYYLRQYRDMKYSIAVESLRYNGMIRYAQACRWTLSRAHARAGDSTVIAGYLGKSSTLDRAITSSAKTYAQQNERVFQELKQAELDGIIQTCDETRDGECPSADGI